MVYAYITDQLSDIVYVVDTEVDGISATITVGNSPTGAAVTPDGLKVYVANRNDNTVSVIRTSDNTVSKTITVGSVPNGVAITPNGAKAYVTNGAGTVSVIDTSTDTVSATITVGSNPWGVAITPDGGTAYVANASSGTVSVINTSNNTVSKTITVGTSPAALAVSPDGTKVYVPNQSSGTVSVIDTSTNTVSSTITIGSLTDPSAVAFTLDGKTAYVANLTASTISVINTSTGSVSSTITGRGEPGGIALTPDGSKAYVTNGADGSVSVINTSTNTISTTLTGFGTAASFGNFIQQEDTMSGFINKFRNAAFNVWQRGTSGTITAGTPAYTADGWIVGCTGANVPWAQTAGRNATRYGLKVTGATSVTDVLFKQRIESFLAAQLYPNASAQVTIQAKVYNNTGSAITPTLTVKHAGSADNWSSPTTDVNAVSLQSCANATLTTVAYTFASASGTPNGLEVTIDCGNNFGSNTKSVEVFEWDIRVTPGAATGLNSAPPTPEFCPISLEYAVSQYYLPGINTGGNAVTGIAQGECTGSTSAFITFFTPVATRVPVTGISISSASHFGVSDSTGAAHTCTSVTFASANLNSYSVNLNVASGLSAGNATQLQTTSSSANLVFTGAEL